LSPARQLQGSAIKTLLEQKVKKAFSFFYWAEVFFRYPEKEEIYPHLLESLSFCREESFTELKNLLKEKKSVGYVQCVCKLFLPLLAQDFSYKVEEAQVKVQCRFVCQNQSFYVLVPQILGEEEEACSRLIQIHSGRLFSIEHPALLLPLGSALKICDLDFSQIKDSMYFCAMTDLSEEEKVFLSSKRKELVGSLIEESSHLSRMLMQLDLVTKKEERQVKLVLSLKRITRHYKEILEGEEVTIWKEICAVLQIGKKSPEWFAFFDELFPIFMLQSQRFPEEIAEVISAFIPLLEFCPSQDRYLYLQSFFLTKNVSFLDYALRYDLVKEDSQNVLVSSCRVPQNFSHLSFTKAF
jgi:hypothetical protein